MGMSYLLEGKVNVCYLMAETSGIRAGIWPERNNMPTVLVEYDLRTFNQIAPLLRDMNNRDVAPKIHHWESGQGGMNFGVEFTLNEAPFALASELLGDLFTAGLKGLYGENPFSLSTSATVAVSNQVDLEEFFKAHDRVGGALIIVRESCDTVVYDELGTFFFLVTTIHQSRPELLSPNQRLKGL